MSIAAETLVDPIFVVSFSEQAARIRVALSPRHAPHLSQTPTRIPTVCLSSDGCSPTSLANVHIELAARGSPGTFPVWLRSPLGKGSLEDRVIDRIRSRPRNTTTVRITGKRGTRHGYRIKPFDLTDTSSPRYNVPWHEEGERN